MVFWASTVFLFEPSPPLSAFPQTIYVQPCGSRGHSFVFEELY